jgi:predicted dehydrogenase
VKILRIATFGAGFWVRGKRVARREVVDVDFVAINNRSRDKAEKFVRDLRVPVVYDEAEKLLCELKL